MSPVLRAVLEGQYPSGKNQIRLSAPAAGVIRRSPRRKFEDWRGTSYAQLDRQRGAWAKLTVPAQLTVQCYKGDLIGRDMPGVLDALLHVLEWCPVHKSKRRCPKTCPLPFVLNDNLLEGGLFGRPVLDRARPRIELVIVPYNALAKETI